MECLECRAVLVKTEQLFFYIKGPRDVHLSIKPELQIVVLAKDTIYDVQESKKKIRVKCRTCNGNVGCVLPFGPEGTKFYAFACDKVKLCSRSLGKAEKWWNIYQEFQVIDTRDPSSFFNVLTAPISSKAIKEKTVHSNKIVYPSLSNLSDFEWQTVSLVKRPRYYQIQGYVEALQRHLIVVIKTGAGKTLIASMFLGKMCSLNPGKMGLMIVDRIPLVFQQGDAIQADTNLRVIRICGENRTSYKIKQINNGHFDVLVVTAGAFAEMVKRDDIDTSLFCAVVLDECHHVSGQHKYVEVLNMFTAKPYCEQPRILSMTASPFSANSIIQAEKRLDKYLQSFPYDTKIYFPDLPKSNLSSEINTVEYSYKQQHFVDLLVAVLNELLQRISRKLGLGSPLEMRADLLNSYQLVGDLRAMVGEFENFPTLDDHLKLAFIMIDALQMCAILGVPMACEKLKECSSFSEIVKKFENVTSHSLRLQSLDNYLRNTESNSKVLIFSHTRAVARKLYNYILKNYPQFGARTVVGHGGVDGMGWEGEQEEVLKEFKNGECNLLVCTSVLEEGLDVASCDLVICFTGVRSLIQLVQTRGRARKKESKFICFQSKFEAAQRKDIHEQEEILKTVLRQKHNVNAYFSDLSKDIIKKIQNELSENSQSIKDDQIMPLQKQLGDSDFIFTAYADYLPDVNEAQIKNRFIEILDDTDCFKVHRLEVSKEGADLDSATKGVFPKDTIVFLVGAKCRTGQSITDTYDMFCRTFDFQIPCNRQTSSLWTKRYFTSNDINALERVDCTGYGVGHFVDKTNAAVSWRERNVEMVFQPKKHIELMFLGYRAMIPFTSIGKFAVLSVNEQTCTLACVVTHPPKLYIGLQPDWFRIFGENEELVPFAENPVLFVKFNLNHLSRIRSILKSPFLFPSPTFDVKLNFHPLLDHTARSAQASLSDRNILWSLKCLQDARVMCIPKDIKLMIQKNIEELCQSSLGDVDRMKESVSLVERIMERIYSSVWKYSYFSNFNAIYSEAFAAFNKLPPNQRKLLDDPIPDNHFIVKRIVVTPSRVVALPAIPVASNRLLRLLEVKRSRLAIVSFKDEDMAKIHDVQVLPRVRDIIVNGIEIENVRYYYLSSTGSQLRENKGYFIAARNYDEVLGIRSLVIPNPEGFSSAAKYISRLGMYGTADQHVMRLKKEDISMVDDEKADNGELTTDGAGKVSMSMTSHIANKLQIDVPSAFQIRYSGFKGMIAATENSDPDLKGKHFAFRPSVKKMENNDTSFCVVCPTKIYDLTLNREVITLLSSIKSEWPLAKYLLDYQEKELAKSAKMFTDGHIAKQVLKQYLEKKTIEELKSCNFEILDERYWFHILQGIYRLETHLIRTKTNIPVEEGCLLVGIPDPYGILKEDEVFVQLRRENKPDKILECPILMYRNPCLHPGDHRRVSGVRIDRLKHLFNVVVLPARNCSYSLAASCSGGDLDGDKFAIIWDQNLVPARIFTYPPCDYEALATLSVPVQPVDVTRQDMLADFFVAFMKNDSLGRVAHKHLALCDIKEDGARDPLAIELAKSQSSAVDYPKTGVPPLVPVDAIKEVDKNGFPDFMEKPVVDSYQSKKILGELYRRCRSVTYDFDVSSKRSNVKMLMNMNLFVKGNEKYLEDAVDVYVGYVHNMEMLMSKFDLKVEADVILGRATYNWSQHLEHDKGKASDAIIASYQVIVKKYRSIFFKGAGKKEARWAKACAWYRVCNDQEIKITGCDKVFLSFPWVVSDVLCEIRAAKQRDLPSRVYVNIGESALALFKKNSTVLLKSVTDKLRFQKDIDIAINKFCMEKFQLKNGFIVAMYGSTSLYVCEPESDVDVCVLATKEVYSSSIVDDSIKKEFQKCEQKEQQKHFLQNVISRSVDSIVSSKREIFNANIPIVKCTSADSDFPLNGDISMNETGLRKTMYIHFLYKTDVCYLPIFWILVRWARVVGLVKSVINSESVLDTAEFYALIIHVLDCPNGDHLTEIRHTTRWTGLKYLYQSLDKIKLHDIHRLGKTIHDFFRMASDLYGNIEIIWPAPQIPKVHLDESQVERIAKYANSAYHCLSATRDAAALQTYCLMSSKTRKEFSKVLPLSVSYAIGKALKFHAARLTQLTGAVVCIEALDGKNNLLLKGEGTQIAIENLRRELRSLIHTNKALVLGRLPQKASRYFMEGASIIIAAKNSSSESLLEFENSCGAFELLHLSHERQFLFLKNETEDSDDWKESEFQRFFNHVLHQLEKFPAHNEKAKESLELTTRFGCFYLVNISSRLPDSQTSISIRELEAAVEKGRKSRKSWKRGEFKPNFDSDGGKPNLPDSARYQMRKLPPLRGRFSEKVGRKFAKQKNVRRGIAGVFTPGLLKENSRDDSARQQLLVVYGSVLQECGFVEGSSRTRQPAQWKVTLSPSSSYEVQISCDEELKIVKVAERSLHWVHGTIITGDKQNFVGNVHTNPDIRMLVSSTDDVKEGSDLYRAVLSESRGDEVLPIQLKDGKPILSSKANEKTKKAVSVVRHVEIRKMFTCDSLDASIVYGKSYFGNKLELDRPFCELTLYFNPEKLQKSLSNHLDHDLLESITREVFETSVKVQKSIERFATLQSCL
ncbi:uncharacterized protein LOC130649592 [Hydractinia symbiolongicarpus]|uniref:uncharacterized protein LOC130649592 n=1 Tax=Hydractinia symbiolongicarpus TaxID=13093 RepID=UPI00254B05A7|nr:uncharacterized protein LOC130649592 [Hydractinia symbiolongicarpus]XP_057311885.1 uncharacterized protein LOC130649592 [Hydractinia symbiolongicarpus]